MKKLLLSIFVLISLITTLVWIRYGGGSAYPDLSTTPLLAASDLEEVLSYAEPVGNVAVNRDGRVFFTVHPEARPPGNKLLEYVAGAAVPFPSAAAQAELFDTVLGLSIDRFNRLWTIDHGYHGLRAPRMIAIDLDNGEVVLDRTFGKALAPLGSFLQDLQVSADGRTVIVADASFWRRTPAIIVYDVISGEARRVLESHASVSAERYVIRSRDRELKFMGGTVALRGGVDGIALASDWLYYAALSGSALYRVRLSDLRDRNLSVKELANRVERYSDKPLSDGLSADSAGNIYITDVEHGAIFIVGEERPLTTLIKSKSLRWPDALSFGPDAYLYLADSALPELILKNRDHIKAAGPYKIFRFRPGFEGTPGQ